MSQIGNDNIKDTVNDWMNERNSLRRFLAGLTATTFGVLVALHPNEFPSILCGWFYVGSVISNAISLFLFILSLFGQYWRLYEKNVNSLNEIRSTYSGKDYEQIHIKHPSRFKIYAIFGLVFYGLAIISSSIYVVIKVLEM